MMQETIDAFNRAHSVPQIGRPGYGAVIEIEDVWESYIDTAGNYHWTGMKTGHHVIPIGPTGSREVRVIDPFGRVLAYRKSGDIDD